MRFGLLALSLAGLAAAAGTGADKHHAPPTHPINPPKVSDKTLVKMMSAAIVHQKADYFIQGPFGLRINRGFVTGNITNPNGTMLATLLPIGSNNGLIDTDGAVHIDSRLTFQFVQDQKYLFLRAEGTYPYLTLLLETDSPTNKWMNNAFVFANFSLTNDVNLLIDAFTTPTQALPHPPASTLTG